MSTVVSLAVRVGKPRTQFAWFVVAVTTTVALYFVTKIEVPAPEPPAPAHATPTSTSTTQLLTEPLFRARDVHLLLTPHPGPPPVPASYSPAEGLAGLALPAAALIVALLLSWERNARRLLREGRDVAAEIRAIPHPDGTISGDDRATEVLLVLPPLPGADADAEPTTVTAIRPPSAIGSRETVIYDPLYPDRAIALADLPGKPRLDEARHALRPSRLPIFHFVIPAAALALLVTLAVSVPLALRAR